MIVSFGAVRVLVLPATGSLIGSGDDANDLIGEAWGQDIEMIAVPLERFSPEFLSLRSGRAGAVFQKFQNYHLRLAVIGDISGAVAASKALRDFVYETNAIGHHRFAGSVEALGEMVG